MFYRQTTSPSSSSPWYTSKVRQSIYQAGINSWPLSVWWFRKRSWSLSSLKLDNIHFSCLFSSLLSYYGVNGIDPFIMSHPVLYIPLVGANVNWQSALSQHPPFQSFLTPWTCTLPSDRQNTSHVTVSFSFQIIKNFWRYRHISNVPNM